MAASRQRLEIISGKAMNKAKWPKPQKETYGIKIIDFTDLGKKDSDGRKAYRRTV